MAEKMSSHGPFSQAPSLEGDTKPNLSRFVQNAVRRGIFGSFQHQKKEDSHHSTDGPKQPPSFDSSAPPSKLRSKDAELESPDGLHTPPAEAQAGTGYISYDAQGQETQQRIISLVDRYVTSKFRTEQDVLVDRIVDKLIPRLEIAASKAVQREMDLSIEELRSETTEEKIQTIQDRIQDLPDDALERLFSQNTMINTLKRLLNRLELDDACNDWEDVGAGSSR
ncbi:Uu.00g107550.m01.CDS01 [Anthostomella pinea]|uniref:Uu.00g107550.m01.CDS01 n=1 Tax=Anthostomella pinea TaxID=933095 RepID=A0AAI8VEC7_9PEZI|nr:Uu.00g107550.m01.CDS01 [Anthostomella pinea]